MLVCWSAGREDDQIWRCFCAHSFHSVMEGKITFVRVPARVFGNQNVSVLSRGRRSCCHRRSMSVKASADSDKDTEPLLRPNILVLGGGFGGLYTTLHLLKLPWSRLQRPNITVVDRSDRFVFLPLLYELLSGCMNASEIAPYYDELFQNTNVKFQQGQIKKLDTRGKKALISAQDDTQVSLNYDRVVLALGAEASLDIIPGAKENSLPFYRIGDAVKLKERLRELKYRDQKIIKVVIIGGGYTGVELAATTAEMLGRRGAVTLLTRDKSILSNGTQYGRNVAEAALNRLDVMIETSAAVERVEKTSVTYKQSDEIETIEADVIITTSGSRPVSVEGFSDLPRTEAGKLKTESTLQVEGFPDMFALGDIAMCVDSSSQKVTKATAQAALQQADYASWNLYASVARERNLPYRYLELGEMMSLGNADASLSALGALNLSGFPAVAMRRAVYLARMPTELHRLRTGASWATRPVVTKANKSISEFLNTE